MNKSLTTKCVSSTVFKSLLKLLLKHRKMMVFFKLFTVNIIIQVWWALLKS